MADVRRRLAALGGRPRAGFHARRLPPPLPDLALWDVVGTVALAAATAAATRRPLAVCLAAWFALGVALHALLGVRTGLVEWVACAPP